MVNLEELLDNGKLTLITFKASWCGPCKALEPIIDQVSEDFKENANFVKIDVDDQTDLALEYGVRSVPTVIFIKDGEVVDKNVGPMHKMQLSEMIESHV